MTKREMTYRASKSSDRRPSFLPPSGYPAYENRRSNRKKLYHPSSRDYTALNIASYDRDVSSTTRTCWLADSRCSANRKNIPDSWQCFKIIFERQGIIQVQNQHLQPHQTFISFRHVTLYSWLNIEWEFRNQHLLLA